MTATLSSKGQVVLPAAARRRLGLKAGTRFDCRIQGSQIVLTPAETRRAPSRFIKSKLTGLVVTQGAPNAPKVTSDQVRALLADFP
jgi:AbrB family looped-hinge helix DNA binding protein